MQPKLDRSRGWRSIREIGSPLRLAGVVWRLRRYESTKPLPPRREAADAGHIDAVKRTLRRYIFLRSMKRTASQYVESMALQPEAYEVGRTLDRLIAEEEKGGAIDRALADAKSGMADDYDLRSLVARRLELDTGRFDETLVEPAALNLGINAYNAYRRGVVLESRGVRDEAERMYRRALEGDPDFSLALRHLGDLERDRDPLAAASFYSDALEFVPKEFYGAPGALHALAVYKNFVIARWNGELIAVPVAVGAIDFSSSWLRSPLRRFAGLFLMRLRLRANGASPASRFSAAPAAVPAPVDQSASAPVAARRSLSSLPRMWAKAAMNWLFRNAYLFQFVLAGPSIDSLKAQIDRIDNAWLSWTAPAESAGIASTPSNL